MAENVNVVQLTVAPEAGEVMDSVDGIVSPKDRLSFPTRRSSDLKTASTFRVPLKATSWNWYRVDGARPRTVHDLVAPMVVPRRGAEHVPEDTSEAEPQVVVPAA